MASSISSSSSSVSSSSSSVSLTILGSIPMPQKIDLIGNCSFELEIPVNRNTNTHSQEKSLAQTKWILHLQNFEDVITPYVSAIFPQNEINATIILTYSTEKHKQNTLRISNVMEKNISYGLQSIGRVEDLTSTIVRRPLIVNMAIIIKEDTNFNFTLNPLLENLASMMGDPVYSDLTIEVVLENENIKIPVHKAILATRSGYFRTMFSIEMKEKRKIVW